jgi:hypothetical protein
VFLVVLDGQDIVAAAVHNTGGDGLLAAQGVQAHQGAVEVQHFQQLGDGGNLIRLIGHGHLAQAEVVVRGPGADQV